jgi:hypothetical protein
MKYRSIRSVTSKSAITPSLSGRTATMLPGFGADRDDLAVVGVERDHRWLVEDDPAATHVHQGVRRAEINRHVASEERHRTHQEREPSDPGFDLGSLLA